MMPRLRRHKCPAGRSPEDALQIIDSTRADLRVFITFGGPQRAMEHSPEDALQIIDSTRADLRVFITFGGPQRAMEHSLTVAARLEAHFDQGRFQSRTPVD